MDDLESLELVSKVTSEIQNHLGILDKTIAEFVIHLHTQAEGVADFKAQLEAKGAEFPQSLIDSLDRTILTLHPKYKKKKLAAGNKSEDADGKAAEDERERKARIFKGLAIPDKEVEYEGEAEEKQPDALDDTFAMLEGLAGKPADKPKERPKKRRSMSPHDDIPPKRFRRRSRSRSPPRRRRDNDEYVFQDEFGRTKTVKRRDEKRGRRRFSDDDPDFARPPIKEIDDEAVLYKVYKGYITGVKDFGAFVRLDGVRGRVDGLVHVTQITNGRVNHPSDLLSRGQEVFTKIIKKENNRVSLTLKDVDQTTGQDLRPQSRIEATGANSVGMDMGGSVPVKEDGYNPRRNGTRKRMTSPERFELKQLIASGVLARSDYPDIDKDDDDGSNGHISEEEEIDIELQETEPPFLSGHTQKSLEISPIRIVKAPEGSLARAAVAGQAQAQERRELRQQEAQEQAEKEAAQTNLSQQWADPLSSHKQFATDLRNNSSKPSAPTSMPEWQKIATQSKDVSFGQRSTLSMKEQREGLPIFKFRSQLLKAISENQVLVVIGETGSGKSTQVSQYLAEAGYADELMIGCTQPRRVAAMSVARRVSEEVGCRLGTTVGFTIRFEDCTSPETAIKYATDGILQREILLDPLLSKYSCIILDEAHERSIATDVLMGLLKKTLKRRPDMKLIVTSATMNAESFSHFYNECPIFRVPGRMYPVEIMYSREPESDYLDATLTTIMQIHLTEPAGDILVFLTGKEEIDNSCEVLTERMKALGPSVPELLVLPCYSALPTEVSSRIFDPAPPSARKVVIATNLAETSITIDGIFYVVDCGMAKSNSYDPKLGMDRLQVMPISQAQANQRSGRAGRTGPGKCFRLYTEAAYQNEMLPAPVPEIQRQNLATTILLLKAMGINDLLRFEFMDPPPTNTMLGALEELYSLGALDDEGLLTRLGRQLADFPMDPNLSKTLVKSVELGCSDDVVSIVAMISATQNVFHRPRDKQQQADAKKAKFHSPDGDWTTLLNVYNGWKASNYSTPWCFENFIQPKNMLRVKDVRNQLLQIMTRHKHQIVSCGRNTLKIRQAICSGFFRHAVRRDSSEGNYKKIADPTAALYLHPSSALFGKNTEHAVYFQVVETTKEYMHVVCAIEPKWLVEVAPKTFKVAGLNGEMSKRKKAERIQPLHNKFMGEDDWRLSAQRKQGRGGGGTWG